MERYVQDIRLKQWCEIIKAANQSGLPRRQWLSENGIGKDAFYYWQRKVRKYYAEQNGLVPTATDSAKSNLVEVPVARDTLALGYILPAVGRIGDFHPL